MTNFETYVARHGEFGVQALIEQIERVCGIQVNIEAPLPLEIRWKSVMQMSVPQQHSIAA